MKWQLTNEISQIIYSLYREKEISKNVYNNITNSIELQNRMDTIFVSSKNSKALDPHRLFHNLTDKISLKWSDKHVVLSSLSIYYIWKNPNLNYQLWHKMKRLNYLMGHNLHQIFKITLSTFKKKA